MYYFHLLHGISNELGDPVRGSVEDGLVDIVTYGDRTHRLRAVGQRLRHRDHVRCDAEGLRGEGLPRAAEAADHLVEHEKDAVTGAYLADALQIALRRHDDAGGPRDRLDEDRCDPLLADQLYEAQQIVGELDADQLPATP